MSTSLRLPSLAAALALLTLAACSKSSSAAAAADSPAAAPAAAKTYTVNLSPALKVGQKFSVATDLSDSEQNNITITIPGMPTPQNQNQNVEMTAHVEADGEILAVFPNGSPQKFSLTLKTIKATQNKADLPNLPAAGAKIVVEKTSTNTTVTVDDKPADEGLAKILHDVYETGNEKYTDQNMFGPKAAVAIGASWPVDGATMIESFKERTGGELGTVNGTMKLDGLTGAGDDQLATVSGNVTLAGIKPPMPPGVTVTIDSSSGTLQLTGTLPNAAKGTAKQSTSMSVKLEAHGEQQGVQLKISTNSSEKKSSEVTYH